MYELILVPLIAGLGAQMLKLLTDGIPNNFTLEHLVRDYGGMPSSHTAFVAALATMVGLREGFDSAVFAVALLVFIVVVRDAVGFRREIGRNATLTNTIGKAVLKNKKINWLPERIGHTVPQVFVGFLFGSGIAVILFFALFQTA